MNPTFKILIPTDFSDESLTAIRFAAKISEQLNDTELILFHSIMIQGISTKMLNEVEDILTIETKEELISISNKINKEFNNSVQFDQIVAYGNPVVSIIDYAKKNHINLIIIGSHGAGGFQKLLMGSNTLGVLNESKCPVIVIPKKTNIQKIEHIVFASDMEQLIPESETMITLAIMLEAFLHIVHIYPEIINAQDFDVESMTKDLQERYNYNKITFYAGMNNNIIEGLKNYIKEFNPDIIAMFTKHRSYFSEISDESLTKNIAIDTEIPLLAIPYND